MRTQTKNKQAIKYALRSGKKIPKYQRDKDGNIKYVYVDGKNVPVETGESEMGYSEPIAIYANISFSGGETQATEFGTNISEYDATIVTSMDAPKLVENALIWYQSAIVWIDEEKGVPDAKSADYRVTKVTPSLNQMKYLLERIQK